MSNQSVNEPSEMRPPAGFQPNPATTLIAIGCGFIVLGGLVAAVTGPLDLAFGSWLAAYLVLAGGVTQVAMGYSRVMYPVNAQPPSWGWTHIAMWNVGSALVVGGTLAGEPAVVSFGSVVLFGALAIAIHATTVGSRSAQLANTSSVLIGLNWAYRLLLLVLAVSIPVGIVLSFVRHS